MSRRPSAAVTAAATAREHAAQLLREAVHVCDPADERHVDAQLACLAAIEALDAPAAPPRLDIPAASAEAVIRHALQQLADLPSSAFTDPRITEAARHARVALRELT
jgi:hypothetical protein